ncbi:G-type lectin S-receptor-like serine/threonine-protein kinase At4g27290 [Hevea brasiliensis]|uniref:G-type lectin S-receptor-like serine/threonine-protein kinase At4g27290 n=1 Tax=Hevea brasiliensis TaxID=3981 RepID=UPI0025DE5C3F|nr:G-type lectin S-receptor-like serine/threonine-protein kinase At4g27290 [Hevea brasiliensis]
MIGILVLFNQSNAVICSSGTSRGVRNPVAQLLDSGNLVVRDEDDLIPENFLWQSFDNPESTFLPGMKIGLVTEGLYVCFSSWKSIDDPCRGNFTFEVDINGLQMYLEQNSVAKARSGDGIEFGLVGCKKVYYTYELVDSSVFTRIVLNQDGLIELSLWVDRTSSWSRYLSAPIDNCDTYALCGAHGSCAISNSPICGCLNGFVLKQKNDWDKANWSSGCVRRMPLDCQKGDGFTKYRNVKLPDMKNSSINESMTLTLEECGGGVVCGGGLEGGCIEDNGETSRGEAGRECGGESMVDWRRDGNVGRFRVS